MRSIEGEMNVSDFKTLNANALKIMTPSKLNPIANKKEMQPQLDFFNDKIAFADMLLRLDDSASKLTTSSSIREFLLNNGEKITDKVEKDLNNFNLERSAFRFVRWYDRQEGKPPLRTYSKAYQTFQLYLFAGSVEKELKGREKELRDTWARKTGGMPPVQQWMLSGADIRAVLDEEVFSKANEINREK